MRKFLVASLIVSAGLSAHLSDKMYVPLNAVTFHQDRILIQGPVSQTANALHVDSGGYYVAIDAALDWICPKCGHPNSGEYQPFRSWCRKCTWPYDSLDQK